MASSNPPKGISDGLATEAGSPREPFVYSRVLCLSVLLAPLPFRSYLRAVPFPFSPAVPLPPFREALPLSFLRSLRWVKECMCA